MSAQSPTKDTGAADDGHAGDALHQFISFAIGDDQYGVDIMAVREIKGWSQINPLPGQPDYMRGVLNLRGAMVPIVDLRCRFGQGMTEATPLHVVIVTQLLRPSDRTAGRSGPGHRGRQSPSRIQAVPRIAEAAQADFLSGLGQYRQRHGRVDRPAAPADGVDGRRRRALETGTHHAAA